MQKIKYSTLAFIFGAVTGFIWLWPVFSPANTAVFSTDTISITRVARLLAPLLVWLLISPRMITFINRIILPKLFQFYLPKSISRLVFLGTALAIFPLITGIIFGNFSFFISAVIPLIVSTITLIGCVLLEKKIFRQWVFGICFVATCFLIVGIITSGLSSTSYYTRPRVLMGFNHPTTTASVILAAGIFTILLFHDRFSSKRKFTRIFLVLFGFIIFFSLLLMAQNRNTVISVFIGIFAVWFGKKLSPQARFSLFLCLLAMPFIIYSIALYGSQQDRIWDTLNNLLSNRLFFYHSSLVEFLNQNLQSFIFAPIDFLNYANSGSSSYRGFAATDSVYLSLIFNYGFPTLISFVILLCVLARKLSSRYEKVIAFGALCGITAYYAMVPEGITASNLAIFIIFIYAARNGIDIQLENVPQLPRPEIKCSPGTAPEI